MCESVFVMIVSTHIVFVSLSLLITLSTILLLPRRRVTIYIYFEEYVLGRKIKENGLIGLVWLYGSVCVCVLRWCNYPMRC